MSERSVELVEKAYDAFGAGEVPAMRALFAEDFELDISGHPIPDFPNRGRGFEHLLAFLSTYLSGFNDYELEVRELRDAGGEVAALLHDRARVGESGAVIERDLAHVWTIDDGLVVRLQAFTEDEAALAAAGIGAGA
jgi:ketosteroid isomerase-like protein